MENTTMEDNEGFEVDPAIAAAMGFSGFGTQKDKKRKFNANDGFVDPQIAESREQGRRQGKFKGANATPLGERPARLHDELPERPKKVRKARKSEVKESKVSKLPERPKAMKTLEVPKEVKGVELQLEVKESELTESEVTESEVKESAVKESAVKESEGIESEVKESKLKELHFKGADLPKGLKELNVSEMKVLQGSPKPYWYKLVPSGSWINLPAEDTPERLMQRARGIRNEKGGLTIFMPSFIDPNPWAHLGVKSIPEIPSRKERDGW